MTEASPALAPAPQFTPEYWEKVPRRTIKAVIERITHKDDGYTEIALKGGAAFQRKRSEINLLLTRNLTVQVEALGNGELITGLFVPDIGWAFRMTNADIAEYTKQLSIAHYRQQRAAIEQTALVLAAVIRQYLLDHTSKACVNVAYESGNDIIVGDSNVDTLHMAKAVMSAMNQIAGQQ